MHTYTFPHDFCLGVADADLQVIGEKYTRAAEESSQTMWDHFATTTDKCFNHDTPGLGIDRYHHYKADIELMSAMGIAHYRTSISMSRILTPKGEINAKAVDWYRTYFAALKKAGIRIYATLYHWELPQYLSENGGWKNRKTIEVFVAHAKAVVQTLGEYIDEYFILNEPWCSSLLSYHLGIHAPGETSLAAGLTAAHHLLLAQAEAFSAMKAINPNLRIGTVFNVQPSYAASPAEKDVLAARYADGYFNRWFFDPLFLGRYPADMVELYGAAMPQAEKADMKAIRIGDKLASLGINYYRGDIVKNSDTSELRYESVTVPDGLTNDLDWPIFLPPHYPLGLQDILSQIYYSYRDHGLPVMFITENGMAAYTPWDGTSDTIDDSRRIHYLAGHLKQVYDAILRGIPIGGYFAWTLMDNYEWAQGYKPNSAFGMIHVDRTSMKRVWKKSAHWYASLIKSRTLTVS